MPAQLKIVIQNTFNQTKINMKALYLSAVLFGCCFASFAQQIRPFHEGDRIVFEGNSITHGGYYHADVWLYYMTHFPGRRIQIFNCGIGGDVAEGMYKRLDSDIFNRKPSVIFLMFGMNDAGYFEFLKPDAEQLAERNIQRSHQYYLLMEKRLKAYSSARKILMASSPFDETAKIPSKVFPKKNAAMLKIADFQEAAARKNGWGFIDLNRPMTAINLREQQLDSSFTLQGGDRIHPEVNGHLIIAYLILKQQGLAGQDVADIAIDAERRMVDKAVNCTLSGLAVSSNTVRFDYLANALPFPVDTALDSRSLKRQSDALRLIPFMKEFNNENLVVKGLRGNKYQLNMNGQKIGVWSGGELAAGINLAGQTNTPEYQQSLAIMELNKERDGIEKRLRDYYYIEYMYFRNKGMIFQDDAAGVDSLKADAAHNIYFAGPMLNYLKARFKSIREAWEAEMKVLVDKIYSMNKPRKYKVELILIE